MNRTTRILLVNLIVIFTATAGALHAQDMPPTLVETDTVQTLDFHEQITLVGRTEANIQSNIVAEVSGQVSAIDAEQGVWVNRGDVLISLDDEPQRLTFEAKKAEAEEARITADLAASNWERTKDLFEKKLVREATRDSIRAWTSIAEARTATCGRARSGRA